MLHTLTTSYLVMACTFLCYASVELITVATHQGKWCLPNIRLFRQKKLPKEFCVSINPFMHNVAKWSNIL